MRSSFFGSVALLAIGSLTTTANAEVFGGIDFPEGAKSFADRVVSLSFGTATGVLPPYDDPAQTLGVPDFVDEDSVQYLSLGNTPANGTQSELVLEFVDNRLIDVDGPDLYVFEIGPRVESTELAISVDGERWFELGAIEGSTHEVDLAAFETLPERALFRFVRLRDRIDGATSRSPFGGPDIDAVGAIGADVQDADDDGIHDDGDNCPSVANVGQMDDDTDSVGNPCDLCRSTPGSRTNDGCPAGGATGADAGAASNADTASPSEDGNTPSGLESDDASDVANCSCRLPGSPDSSQPRAAVFTSTLGLLLGLSLMLRRRGS
jgi:hypothetical protein